jgi:hypothetical protein
MSEKKVCSVCGKEIKEASPAIWNPRESKIALIWHREHENDKYKEILGRLIAKIYGTS